MDVHRPVIHVELECAELVAVIVRFESWPAEKPRYAGISNSRGLQWHYRLDQNIYAQCRQKSIRECGMDGLADKVPDPGRNLTLGGRIVGENMVPAGETTGSYLDTSFKAWSLNTREPLPHLDLRILIRIEQDDNLEKWKQGLDALETTTARTAATDFEQTRVWWREFWGRSHIVIQPATNCGARDKDPAWQVGRNYQLFRYMLACNCSGRYPTLFNGGFFNVDTPTADNKQVGKDPDSRLWAGCGFMAQNQRLIHWPMIKAGDVDLIRPALRLYRDTAPTQQARARKCWGVDGTPFPEPMDWCGLFAGGLGSPSGHCGLEHLEHHYTSSLDFAYMMIEHVRFSGCDVREFLPVIEGIVSYYDQYYRRENKKRTGQELDASGRLAIFPSNALEFGIACRNNSDVVAGLQAVSAGLLALPDGVLPESKRAWYREFRKRIPLMCITMESGHRVLAVAESMKNVGNPSEIPQLYPVFPFGLYGMGLPDLELARDTWRYTPFTPRQDKHNYICWYQGGIFTARLGLTEEAKSYAIKKFLHSGSPPRLLNPLWPLRSFPMRFPTYYNTFTFDHVPCMDHGGCAMIGLQKCCYRRRGGRFCCFRHGRRIGTATSSCTPLSRRPWRAASAMADWRISS